MNDASPNAAAKIALLFDDAEQVGELCAALREHGARIVHEGSLAQFDRAQLERSEAQVLVLHLDDGDEGALDRLYDMLDGDRVRLVFNDAQASRHLRGRDRARWARHLAMKTLVSADSDPPRPAAALPLDRTKAAAAATAPEATASFDGALQKPSGSVSASLEAEFAALLATDAFQLDRIDEFDANPEGDDPKLDGLQSREPISNAAPAATTPAPPLARDKAIELRTFQLDHLSLLPLDTMPGSSSAPHVAPYGQSPIAPDIEWELVSNEQAIAAQHDQAAYEMQLDDLGMTHGAQPERPASFPPAPDELAACPGDSASTPRHSRECDSKHDATHSSR